VTMSSGLSFSAMMDMVQNHNSGRAKTVRFVSGYPEGLFVDNRPPDVFHCSICIDTANDPVMCGNQHTFCRECMSEWLRAHQSCPACKVRVTVASLVRNRTAAEFIGQCKVRCLTAIPEDGASLDAKERKTAKKDICDWVGTTDTLDRHMQECGYIQVPCERGTLPIPCPWKGRRGALAEHTAVCEYRKVACIYCGTEVQVFGRALHQAGRKWRPALCSNIGCNIESTLMTSQASAASQTSRGGPIKALKREDTYRTEGSFQLSPANNSFAKYDSSRDQLTAGGFRWGLEVVEIEGLVWACLTLLEGGTCPFTIDYHLYSIGGGFNLFTLDISKTLSGTMGECAAGARKGVILTSRKELDQWHYARHTLHLHTTFAFKIT
jgi:hypothetical protein